MNDDILVVPIIPRYGLKLRVVLIEYFAIIVRDPEGEHCRYRIIERRLAGLLFREMRKLIRGLARQSFSGCDVLDEGKMPILVKALKDRSDDGVSRRENKKECKDARHEPFLQAIKDAACFALMGSIYVHLR